MAEKNINEESQPSRGGQADSKKPGVFGSLKPGGKGGFSFYWIYGVLFVIFIAFQFLGSDEQSTKTTWGVVLKHLESGDVKKIVVENNELARITLNADSLQKGTSKFAKKKPVTELELEIGSAETFEKKVEEAQSKLPAEKRIYIDYITKRNWGGEVMSIMLPLLLLLGLWFVIMRMMNRGSGGGQIFNIGKSKAQLYDKDTMVTINFNDVAGLEGAKIEIMEIVDFLKNPKKYTDLGGKIPKGALLVGPPGTGKTLLAKAVAGEAKVPFFSLSGSDFVEMFVGVGASRVRDLFKQAKEKAPCIIFIDEIDAIGRARGKNPITGSNDERENTLNQLLTEMDGFSTNSGVIILAATNRADILDRALLRAGRFDRTIQVELPDLEERKAIFGVHLRGIKFDKTSVDIDLLSKQTPGFSGADIANVCNEAALIAARTNKVMVEKQDFLDAIDRIIGGLEKRNKIITAEEKRVIAFHEAGHAAVSWLLKYAHPLVKVTIVPRGNALGAAWYLPEERQITTKEQLFDEMTATLGGRASEQVNFGKISTGALNDLERVTKQAYNMVVFFGLNDKLGNVSYYDSSGQEYSFQKPYSENTAQIIDEEISKLIEESYSRAVAILTENKDKVVKLAERLLEKEVIFSEDVESIFGSRPFGASDPILRTAAPVEAIAESAAEAEEKAEGAAEVEEKNSAE